MTQADIAVVGGGIVGCAIAREIIARSGRASVVLVDRDAVGCGASRRSAGLHFPRGSTERVRRMSSYSQDYYEKLRANQPTLPIYPVGMSVVSEAPERQLRESYLDTAGLTRRENVPGAAVRVPERAAVWRVDGGHYADVQGLAQDFARELRSRVSFREGVRVAAIEPIATGVVLYLSSGDTLTVGQVVLAPGPWLAAPAWRSLVAPLGARVKKVVALHIEQCPTVEDQAIVFHDEDAFLVPFAHRGHWLFSYTCQEWDVDPDVVGAGLYPHNVAEARDCLHRFAPTLAARCTSGRVFCDAYSPTGNPIVRTLDPAGRMVFAGAANGSGYRLAPAMAAEATDLLDLPAEPRSAP